MLIRSIINLHISEKLLARIIAGSVVVAITSLIWDAWWHVAVGRDTFWSHLTYFSIFP